MQIKLRREMLSHYSKMQKFAIKLCANPHDAEDLVQQAYAQALNNLQQFKAGTQSDSWLYRIIQNLYLNALSADAVKASKTPYLLTENENKQGSEQSLSDEYALKLRLKQTLQKVQELPENYRTVLIFISIQGFSYQEVAQLLDIPIGTVTSRLARARAMLVEKSNNTKPVTLRNCTKKMKT